MKSFFVLAITILFTACATPKYGEVLDEKFLEFNRKGSFPGYAEHLNTLVNLWIVESFNDAETVIRYSNEDDGIIALKYTSGLSNFTSKSLLIIRIDDNIIHLKFRDPRVVEGLESYPPLTNNKLLEIYGDWGIVSESLFVYVNENKHMFYE